MTTTESTKVINHWFSVIGQHHITYLRWHISCGVARYGNTYHNLYSPPGIQGDDIVYYAGKGTIDGVEMNPAQLECCRHLLVKMDAAAEDAVGGHSTLEMVSV